MRNTSFLAALMVLIGVSSLNLSGCVDPNDDDDSVVDDDDTGDDDDSTGVVFAPITVTVNATTFLSEALGNVAKDFQLYFNGELVEELELYITSTEPVEFEAVSDDYLHATCKVRLVADALGKVTVEHANEFLSTYPQFETDDVEDHRDASFEVHDGDTITIPLNYDSTGTWDCLKNTTPYTNPISENFGEVFGAWFGGTNLYANGHQLKGWTNGGVEMYDGIISADGQTWSGTVVDEWETRNVSCERQ